MVACEATNGLWGKLIQGRLLICEKDAVDCFYVVYTLRDKILNNYIKQETTRKGEACPLKKGLGFIKGMIIILAIGVVVRYFAFLPFVRDYVNDTSFLKYIANNNLIANMLGV